MKTGCRIAMGLLAVIMVHETARGNERIFTYTYEPETMPEGAREFEQLVTLGAGRTATVGQQDYRRWEVRDEFEYGVNDDYTVSLYLNSAAESFRDPATGGHESDAEFTGVSLENRYQVLNPANHAVGLTLYLEPRIAADEAEVEQKIILGQRQGDWKWALNFTHATEWKDSFHDMEGELEVSLGVARYMNKRWTFGVELRDHNELPDYKRWENTALFFGPVVSYRQENWWATLSVLAQVYGANFGGDPDGNPHLELEGHERVNSRLFFGISF